MFSLFIFGTRCPISSLYVWGATSCRKQLASVAEHGTCCFSFNWFVSTIIFFPFTALGHLYSVSVSVTFYFFLFYTLLYHSILFYTIFLLRSVIMCQVQNSTQLLFFQHISLNPSNPSTAQTFLMKQWVFMKFLICTRLLERRLIVTKVHFVRCWWLTLNFFF